MTRQPPAARQPATRARPGSFGVSMKRLLARGVVFFGALGVAGCGGSTTGHHSRAELRAADAASVLGGLEEGRGVKLAAVDCGAEVHLTWHCTATESHGKKRAATVAFKPGVGYVVNGQDVEVNGQHKLVTRRSSVAAQTP